MEGRGRSGPHSGNPQNQSITQCTLWKSKSEVNLISYYSRCMGDIEINVVFYKGVEA